MFPQKVLVIEDDQGIAEAVCDHLAAASFRVRIAPDGKTGLSLCLQWKPDIAILDLGLPVISGIELLKCFRKERPRTKVLVVSGSSELEQRLTSFSEGADDFLTKPFSARELIARVRALTRRDKLAEKEQLDAGDFRLERDGRAHTPEGCQIRLTPTEAALLRYLMERNGSVISRNELLDAVWSGKDRYPNIVDATVESVRRRLRHLSERPYVHTAYRSGYYFEVKETPAKYDDFSGNS